MDPIAALVPRTVEPSALAHEHGWQVESQHQTSVGCVIYVRCGACGVRRVDVLRPGDQMPTPLSAELQ